VGYIALEGSYTTAEIRQIYRESSIYFLASSEAFGLPICELQACGAKVFLPDPHWASSHWLGKDYFIEREPELSPNFVVYENDPHALSHRIREVADSINPAEVRATFERVQPELFHGDMSELTRFLEMIDSGAIHSRLHEQHATIARTG
jgi:glycosyltransferase involved in cell wall biosynthesis